MYILLQKVSDPKPGRGDSINGHEAYDINSDLCSAVTSGKHVECSNDKSIVEVGAQKY